jgi:uncharacterized SAM-binding protein YcdF (DUF218 family)
MASRVHRRDAEDAENAQRIESDSITLRILGDLCVSAVSLDIRPKAAVVRNQKARRILLIVCASLAVWSLLAWFAAHKLIVSAELSQADALLVLAGSSTYRERARRAAELFHEGRAPKIILTNDNQLSGWSNELQRNPFFFERAAAELARAGVPRDRVEILPQAVSSTHDEALLVREYAKARGLRSIMIVTSAYHSRRALWTFRRTFEGSRISLGLTAVAPGEQTPPPATWWLHPHGWDVVAGEYLKFIYYRLRYH